MLIQLLQKLYSHCLNYYFYSTFKENEVQARQASTEFIFNLLFIIISVTTLTLLIFLLKIIGINYNTKNFVGKLTLLVLTYIAYTISKKRFIKRLNEQISTIEITHKQSNNYIIYYCIGGIFAYFSIITSLIILFNKIF